jgi:hypothetical protein
LGTVVIKIKINNAKFITKIDLVENSFPIPGAGIIGRNFLKENKVILDMNQELLLIPEPVESKSIIISPRSNCVLVIINDENITYDAITIFKQDVNDEVIIANSVSPITENEIISNIINIFPMKIKFL